MSEELGATSLNGWPPPSSANPRRPGPHLDALSHHTPLLPTTRDACSVVAEDKGVVGRVNWQFLPRSLKSFMSHYWSVPTMIGFTCRTGKQETSLEPRLMKTQGRSQETSLFNNSACALVRPYPDDARQRVRGKPRGFCRCNRPRVCCPDRAHAQDQD